MTSSSWLFNVGADIYAWFTAPAALRGRAAQLSSRLANTRVRAGDWVVDLGCGPGVSTFELARRLPAAHLIGLDVSPRMLGQERRRQCTMGSTSAHITWLQADAVPLPSGPATLDACTGDSSLYLVARSLAVLA